MTAERSSLNQIYIIQWRGRFLSGLGSWSSELQLNRDLELTNKSQQKVVENASFFIAHFWLCSADHSLLWATDESVDAWYASKVKGDVKLLSFDLLLTCIWDSRPSELWLRRKYIHHTARGQYFEIRLDSIIILCFCWDFFYQIVGHSVTLHNGRFWMTSIYQSWLRDHYVKREIAADWLRVWSCISIRRHFPAQRMSFNLVILVWGTWLRSESMSKTFDR